jgi:hypothetical protein
VPIDKKLSVKNVRAWVSMVSYARAFLTLNILAIGRVEGIAIRGFECRPRQGKKCWQMGWIGCPILLVAQNTIEIF